jgi:hypothetical protein
MKKIRPYIEMSPLYAGARALVQGFSDYGAGSDSSRDVYMDTLSVILAFTLSLVILAFIGQLLWNNVVVDLFSFAKPAKSFLHILGLMVFVNLLLPCP